MGFDLDRLSRLIDALDPWLAQVIIVGGWAHRLFRYHPLAQAVPHEPLLTNDADVAVPAALDVAAGDLRDRLIGAGFKERLTGDDQPPAGHYKLGDEGGVFFAEFLTPLGVRGRITRGSQVASRGAIWSPSPDPWSDGKKPCSRQ